jgi:malate synthase
MRKRLTDSLVCNGLFHLQKGFHMSTSTHYIDVAGIKIEKGLHDFLVNDALPGTGIDAAAFFESMATLFADCGPKNRALLQKRAQLQHQIDEWHQSNDYTVASYKAFLKEIGYLVDEVADFSISTKNVDAEIATTAAPQLVVPVNNARYALNAANARWGSVYDAVYGSDMLPEAPASGKGLDEKRAAAVVAYTNDLLKTFCPLANGEDYANITGFSIDKGILDIATTAGDTTLADNNQFAGYQGDESNPSLVLLVQNGRYIELHINRDHPIGKNSSAGVCDVIFESAATVIQDCEDSVAAVDGEDKTLVYRNWLGLMKGDLSTEVKKGDKSFTRTLNEDREYIGADGSLLVLPGRALILVRNVGHLMTTPAVLDANGDQVFEGQLDALITSMIAMHDLQGNGQHQNSREGSVYIVKPKMHGPEEVAFAVELFGKVEDVLGLDRNTLKIGLMDEEKRTTVNLKACIHAARERLIFINTGFLDRTGDEIHTAMMAGPVVRKAEMKTQAWIKAYEDWNVDIGLACGLSGKAQIGKGMWAMPDEMAAMVEQKIAHPKTGANCAWVPSPTAATLHAIHYHQVDVWAEQEKVKQRGLASLDDLLTLPLATGTYSAEEIQQELNNNCQGILGYVVRWIDQGVGCSKVPDISDTGLMEDRATLRISSQHIANWLYHGWVNEKQIIEAMRRMAKVVDGQNANDPTYTPIAPTYQGYAFESSKQLVFRGREVPSGYTEPVLHAMRLSLKNMAFNDLVQAPVMRFF